MKNAELWGGYRFLGCGYGGNLPIAVGASVLDGPSNVFNHPPRQPNQYHHQPTTPATEPIPSSTTHPGNRTNTIINHPSRQPNQYHHQPTTPATEPIPSPTDHPGNRTNTIINHPPRQPNQYHHQPPIPATESITFSTPPATKPIPSPTDHPGNQIHNIFSCPRYRKINIIFPRNAANS